MSEFTYRRTEFGAYELWTVFTGDHPVSDHTSEREARNEAIRLNGGVPMSEFQVLAKRVIALEETVAELRRTVASLSVVSS